MVIISGPEDVLNERKRASLGKGPGGPRGPRGSYKKHNTAGPNNPNTERTEKSGPPRRRRTRSVYPNKLIFKFT